MPIILETIPNQTLNLLILIVSALFYLGIIYFRKLQRDFSASEQLLIEKPAGRLPFFDFAKGVAILAVIVIHTSFLMNSFAGKLPPYFMDWNEMINKFFRFAIAVFLISSGALLTLSGFDKKSLGKFYSDKFKRIIIPYLFFASYRFFSLSWEGSFIKNLFSVLRDILTGNVLPPFWFISVLIQLYFLFPLLRYFLVRGKRGPEILLVSAFTFSLSCYLLSSFWSGWYWFFGESLFFFVLGMVLRPLLLSERREWLKKISFPLWSFLAVVLYLGIALINPSEKYYNAQFVYGPTIFLLIFYYYNRIFLSGSDKLIRKIGQNSLYIYFIHSFVLIFLAAMVEHFNLFYINPFILFTGLALLNFLVTYPLSFWAKRTYDFLLESRSTG